MIENPRDKLTKQEKVLREVALAFPDTSEDFPWGHRTFKVNKKAFVFMNTMEGVTSLSLKLPDSNEAALKMKNAEPTHYGLGKHGWVSLTFDSGDELPMGQLKAWIDESFRAVAPKTLLKKMSGVPAASAPSKARRRPRKKA